MITPEHRAAIDRLSLQPGRCAAPGCNEPLLCVFVEPWERGGAGERFDLARAPRPRFACPVHEVWLGECFDAGDPDNKVYSDGLYHAVLRDVADPAWRWLPEPMRGAAARAGFAVQLTPSGHYPYPRLWVGTCSGRAWGTDGRTVLDLGPAAEAEAALERMDLQVHPASALAAELARHRLPEAHIAGLLTACLDARPVQVGPAEQAGLGARWKGFVAVGRAVVPEHVVTLVTELYGAVSWRGRGPGPLDPVVAFRGRPVAIVMPVDVEAAELAAREEVDDVRRETSNKKGRL